MIPFKVPSTKSDFKPDCKVQGYKVSQLQVLFHSRRKSFLHSQMVEDIRKSDAQLPHRRMKCTGTIGQDAIWLDTEYGCNPVGQ